ncbi:MAG: hypothetical protein CO113_01150 [Elusimicrobia bacterium CG_4_9_14_3_um_filter_62_55]|nr:MAG: hypothetical protein COR54_14635 [Elusimicrobia bacterium CG22_combo_CG10-13_8_21_14_all_63_91]PJA16341.1 MAG: hypothetical protein COX66_07695 [Elusimicrobia bacterium CG_4_10_14_0_2_um_filter_63_34]PJB26878.1 MAG: hypothetical protein CO113_01150 [Elusimicrobia bacterium CG_4_9_14_3_um_filter_62_55]
MARFVCAVFLFLAFGLDASAGPNAGRGPVSGRIGGVFAPAPAMSLAPAEGFSFSLSAPLGDIALQSSFSVPEPAGLPTAPALAEARTLPVIRPQSLVPQSQAVGMRFADRPRKAPEKTRAGSGLRERLGKTPLETAAQFSSFFDGTPNAADASGDSGWSLIPSGVRRWWAGRRERSALRRSERRALDTAPFGARIRANYAGGELLGKLAKVDDTVVLVVSEDGTQRTVKRTSLSEIEIGDSPGEIEGISTVARRRFEDRRAFYEFRGRDLWAGIAEPVRTEIEGLRALPNAAERKARLREIGDRIVEGIKRKRGIREIGFHYNLHGGNAEGYVKGGGIRAGRGDIALQYSTQGDMAYKVYLFRSAQVNLYDILDTSNPNLVSPRMGHVLNIFDGDSEYLRDAFAKGGALKPTAISIDFEEGWLNKRGMIGIPYSTYLAPPIEPFGRSGVRFGLKGRLTKDEETLAAMRYLEAAVLLNHRP